MKKHRIRFYPINDLCFIHFYEDISREYIDSLHSNDINDVVELFNIKRVLNEAKANLIGAAQRNSTMIKLTNDKISHFMRDVKNYNHNEWINQLESVCIHDFIEFIVRYKIYDNLNKGFFEKLTTARPSTLNDILYFKPLVDYIDEELKSILLNHDEVAVIFITSQLNNTNLNDKIYIPKSINNEDMNRIFLNYIQSQHPHPNYLDMIVNIKVINNLKEKNNFKIVKKIKLQAKRRAKEISSQFYKSELGGITFSTKISVGDTSEYLGSENTTRTENGEHITEITYSKDWILNNKDEATLLNNFIYLLEFCDITMCWNNVSGTTDGVILENLRIDLKDDYPVSHVFNHIEYMRDISMQAYYKFLKYNNIFIEDLIYWFFSQYLSEQFNIHGFQYNKGSRHSTNLEKCRHLFSELESILKQFELYVNDGEIDLELLEMQDGDIRFQDVKSLVSNKYVYPSGKEYETVTNLLFSDQCSLNYIFTEKYESNCFAELISNYDIKHSDIAVYNKGELDYLMENGYIKIDNGGYIRFIDEVEILTLYRVFQKGVIACQNDYYRGSTKVISQLVQKEMLEYCSSLFSNPESDYLNFYLNNSTYTNSIGLRNKYSHGTQQQGDDAYHYQNYMIGLRLFIMVIIKINDDICTHFDCKERDNL